MWGELSELGGGRNAPHHHLNSDSLMNNFPISVCTYCSSYTLENNLLFYSTRLEGRGTRCEGHKIITV